MKPKQMMGFGLALLLAAVAIMLGGARLAAAQQQEGANLVRGAMLYDKWYAVLNVSPPDGNMPLWDAQSTNTRSGADTWRCVSCHGWDYQGKNGAYRSGSNFTGFPGLLLTAGGLSDADIAAVLKGAKDPKHDLSKYLDDAAIADLALFIKTGLIDDNQFIDPKSLAVIGGDAAHGQSLFDAQCATCHGADGATIKFRFEGRDATLGTLAVVDPWRFLHKTRFGTPGTPMVIGYDLKWTAQDGRDVLLYAQSLPNGLVRQPVSPPVAGMGEQVTSPGGPASNLFTGLLTAFGAMATSLGFAVLFGAFLVGVIFVIVWQLRDRRKK